MASRLITTSFAIVSAAALLAGCETISSVFDGNSKQSSGSTGVSQSASTGNDTRAASQGSSTYGHTGTTAGTTDGPTMSTIEGESLSAEQVKRAQQALRDQGYYKGQIDGVVGPQTRGAVARYQREHNLKQTAMLDEQTVRALDQRMSANTRR